MSGRPTDVETDLQQAFPQKDSLFRGLIPPRWFEWKEQLYEKTGLRLGLSYQALYQSASDTRTGQDTAAAGWLLVEGKWELLNRGEDTEGNLVFALDWRHTLGDNAEPGLFGTVDVGSLWPTDIAFIEWDAWFPVLYWEQWLEKESFVLRAGTQVSMQILDFFRFKDSRTSFTGTPLTAPAGSIPFGPPGGAVSFGWWPQEGSELYVVGSINDQNAEVGEISWDNAFEYGQFFYGLEVGQNWRRGGGEFDHAHLLLFYADEADMVTEAFGSQESGGGFKLAGSKQSGQLVGFGSYTYNTAEGGGFGITFAEHTVTAGAAVLRPVGYNGELALGATWAKPIDDQIGNQYGFETYWRLLVTPDLWVTPGVQVIFDPAFNTAEDVVTIAQIKFRLFL